MPGKPFSHILFRCLGAAVLMSVLIPGLIRADAYADAPVLVDLADETVPSWCHLNLQLVSEPTHWPGYRDVQVLKRRFNPLPSSPVLYRGFAADRNVYTFSSEVTEAFGVFAAERGHYTPTTGDPQASAISIYLRASNYDVLVWCAMPNRLVAVRANDPTNLSRYGDIAVSVTPRDLFVQFRGGRYTIYAANGTDSLRVYQLPVLNWITLEHAGAIDTPGDAQGLAFKDSLLYVADGNEGVEVIDVTHLNAMTVAGHYQTVGPAKKLAVRDSLLFVAEWEDGVEILNAASVDSIFPVARIDTPGRAHDVAVDGSLLYVADWDGGLRVYNFARPDSIYLYGFYGVGQKYHSVAVSDSIVMAGDHAGLKIFRQGPDRLPPVVTSTITQTPFFRRYLRAYVLASECLQDLPRVQQILIPRQTTVDDFESYANSDSLRLYWKAVDTATDTASLVTSAFEGSQAMRFRFSLPKNTRKLLRREFTVPQDWRLFDRLSFYYKTETDTIMGKVRATVFSAVAGDSVAGTQVVSRSGWNEYTLDISGLAHRDRITKIRIGVLSVRSDITVTGKLLVDRIVLSKIHLDDSVKGEEVVLLGDTVDVDVSAVSESRHLYMGDFMLAPSDTGLTNALLITATDESGNTSATLKEYRAQLVVPSQGGVLRSPDSRISLAVPPGATREGSFFFILPQEFRDVPPIPETAEALGRIYEVGMSESDLLRDVDLSFRIDRGAGAGTDADLLGIYRLDGNGWQYLGGRYDAESGTVRVSVRELGTLVLLSDPYRPATADGEAASFRSYPNPFNPNTTISFACPIRSRVSLKIYDVGGRLVKTLVEDVRNPGSHFVTWNGEGDTGPATSGLYFARLEVGETVQTIKLVLIR